jgi:peptidoglycan/xylan/chitin deacetylase (PgdA/CDA1 family)
MNSDEIKVGQKKIAITVDFENFSHDLGRVLGVTNKIRSRESALLNSYEFFMQFMSENFDEVRCTFFCTGILAEKNPNIISKIASDGHEIACHYHFHDDFNKDSIENARANLHLAKKILQDVSGQEILGFRAPRFSLNIEDKRHLELITEYFSYDSSLHFSNKHELDAALLSLNINDFREFPVSVQKLSRFLPDFKLGGSYLKLFPAAFVRKAILKTHENNLLPIVYLHPYDLLVSDEFGLRYEELKGLPAKTIFYTLARQRQWTSIGNFNIPKNLKIIANGFDNVGPLGSISSSIV